MARKSNSRAARLERAMDAIRDELRSAVETAIDQVKQDHVGDIEELRDEIENWKTGLEGTNLENSQKYSDLDECYNELDNLLSEIDSMSADDLDLDSLVPDSGSVNFPGMY